MTNSGPGFEIEVSHDIPDKEESNASITQDNEQNENFSFRTYLNETTFRQVDESSKFIEEETKQEISKGAIK